MIKSFVKVAILAIATHTTLAHAEEHCPQWVQCVDPSTTAGEGYVRKTLLIEQPVTSATLVACGDATFLDVSVAGTRVAELEPFDPVLRVDVTEFCAPGKLAIAMRLRASPPLRCAAFVQVDFKYADGTTWSLVTDGSWQCHTAAPTDWAQNGFDDSSWQRPRLLGAVDQRLRIRRGRSTDLDVSENYDQWKQAIGAAAGTDPASFQLAEGFEIELLRSAHEEEDSWVSMAFDPEGRLIIAKEQVGLLRMTFSTTGSVERVESVNHTMKECRGLLFIGDDLYVNANNSKGLYRLPIDANDQFGTPERIYESTGGVGHGRNDLAMGPDGRIYSIHGDSVELPSGCRDLTSPFRDARRGIKTSEGHLLRIDPQTKEVEILASGLRNPFGIDFNVHGDAFTYDADAEYDMGAPWYRPTRVSHLTLGGDYGWRGVTKQWPPYYPDHPDNATPGLDIGRGSPTAVKFGTRSNFPERYRQALFILDWTYGRIIAVHAIGRGSSYLMTAETFLQGRPLNVTDLDFGPDGSMYLVTGGRGTQSALYRIRYTGGKSSRSQLTEQQAYRQQISHAMHKRRRQLESQLADGARGMTPTLGSEDPWLRGAARNLLERTDISEWRETALRDASDKTALSALLSLARSHDDDSRPRIIDRLCVMDWPAMSRSWRETAVYTLFVCTQDEQLDERRKAMLLASLESAFPDREYSVNRIVSELLVRHGSERVVRQVLALAASATVQSEQLHYLFVIRNAQAGWTLDDRRTYFRLLASTEDYLGGQGMDDFLTRIRADALESLTAEELEALADVLATGKSIREQSPPTATSRPIVARWTLDALTTALVEVRGPGDPKRGRELFAEASCVHCHRLGGYGRLIGPDLTGVSRRFSQRDLLTAMLEPSKVIPEKYQSIQVVTSEGRVFVGLPALGGDYRSTKLRLATDVLNPYAITEIEKESIEEIRPSSTSWMPHGLLDTFTPEDVADLIAYLNAGR